VRRTAVLVSVALATLAAAATLALRGRGNDPSTGKAAVSHGGAGPLRISAQLDRAFISELGGGEAYLEVDVHAEGRAEAGARVPVNAVLILDRSGSMTGEKLARAKDAARELLGSLNGDDRFALIEFGSNARVLVPSMAGTPAARENALALVSGLRADGGTNISDALEVAAPQLAAGRAPGRVDKVFLASDGQANEGVSARPALLEVARRALAGNTTVSTFGVGHDYDEDLMTSLAAQAGGLTHYIRSSEQLAPAFHAELRRASTAVARNVRLVVHPAAGARVVKVIGYESDGGWVRLPDFAAGERRRVLVKLQLPAGRGSAELARVELSFQDAQGGPLACAAPVEATFTADQRLADKADAPAAFQGARAEIAVLADEAARFASMGRKDEAAFRVRKMADLKAAGLRAAKKPAERAQIESEERGYSALIGSIAESPAGAPAAPPAKEAKQKAFDAIRSAY